MRHQGPETPAELQQRLAHNLSSKLSKRRSRAEKKARNDAIAAMASSAEASRGSARPKKDTLKKREAKGPLDINNPKTVPASLATLTLARIRLPPPKLEEFRAPSIMGLTPTTDTIELPDGTKIPLFTTADFMHNKKGFRYENCVADPRFPSSQYFRQTEIPPFHARASFEDSHEHILFDETALIVTTDKGWRMARANVCARAGRWFYEVHVVNGVDNRVPDPSKGRYHKHCVRMGWARREADLESNVGRDAYGYGLRDVGGQKSWCSRLEQFFPPGEEIQTGDVIGLEIGLPSEQLHHKIAMGDYNPAVDTDENQEPIATAVDVVRDRMPTHVKGNKFFELFDYVPAPEMEKLSGARPIPAGVTTDYIDPEDLNPMHVNPIFRTLPGSYIRVFKNGKDMGLAFENLLAFLAPASKPMANNPMAQVGLDDGTTGYYPAISVLRGSSAAFNFGPNFKYPPPGYQNENEEVDMIGKGKSRSTSLQDIRPMSDRYREQISADVVHDLVDEVTLAAEDDNEGINSVANTVDEAGRSDFEFRDVDKDDD